MLAHAAHVHATRAELALDSTSVVHLQFCGALEDMGAPGLRSNAKKRYGKHANISNERSDSDSCSSGSDSSSSDDSDGLGFHELADKIEVMRMTSNFEARKVFAREDTLAEYLLVRISYYLSGRLAELFIDKTNAKANISICPNS